MKKNSLLFFMLIGITQPVCAVLVKNLTQKKVNVEILGVGKQRNKVIQKITLPPKTCTVIPAQSLQKGKTYTACFKNRREHFDRCTPIIEVE